MKTIRNTRRAVVLLLVMATLLSLIPWVAQAAGARVFSYADIEAATAELETVGDYVKVVNPSSYSWYSEEATGITYIHMTGKESSVQVMVDMDMQAINGKKSTDHYEQTLPAKVRKMKAAPSYIYWLDASSKIPVPRGVNVGASKKDVLKAYKNLNGKNGVLYTGKSINAKATTSWWSTYNFIGGRIILDADGEFVIEYKSCSPFSGPEQEEWREYYGLSYYLDSDDKVEQIVYRYDTDPE